jgi:hypothetical protein
MYNKEHYDKLSAVDEEEYLDDNTTFDKGSMSSFLEGGEAKHTTSRARIRHTILPTMLALL